MCVCLCLFVFVSVYVCVCVFVGYEQAAHFAVGLEAVFLRIFSRFCYSVI